MIRFIVFILIIVLLYVGVCACIRSAELQSSKSPTKRFILSKREGPIPGEEVGYRHLHPRPVDHLEFKGL